MNYSHKIHKECTHLLLVLNISFFKVTYSKTNKAITILPIKLQS